MRSKKLAFRETLRVPRVAGGTRMRGIGPDRLRARKGRREMKKQKKEAGFIVTAELPGLQRSDIDVDLSRVGQLRRP